MQLGLRKVSTVSITTSLQEEDNTFGPPAKLACFEMAEKIFISLMKQILDPFWGCVSTVKSRDITDR